MPNGSVVLSKRAPKVCCCVLTGQPFALAGGANGKQGMLHAVLKDRLAGRDLVAATTHLKAKAGQVRTAMLKDISTHAVLCQDYIVALELQVSFCSW